GKKVGCSREGKRREGCQEPHGHVPGGLDGSSVRGSQDFLRCYYHHIAFRRLTLPAVSSHGYKFPARLRPTCLHVCGHMVLVGMDQGLSLLFDTTPARA
ncbi:unnamed protein product, partial [Discosporangium mesarthrocarpum]